MDKKYELLENDTITIGNKVILYRIKAVKDFGNVKAGDIGGYIQSEDNLSHEGNTWVSGNARIYGNARAYGNAWISGNARVFGNAMISGNAWAHGDATIYDNVRVSGNTWVYGNARVSGNTWVYGNAGVFGNAMISGNARVFGNAMISGNARVSGNAWVSGNAYIDSTDKYLSIGPIGSRNGFTTFYLDKSGIIWVNCGCFNDSIDEFEKAVNNTHKNNEFYRNQYLSMVEYTRKYLTKNKEET